MIGIGPCSNFVYRCSVCGYINGGATEGGIPRDCDVCPYQGMCPIKEGEMEKPPEVGRICFKQSCIIKATIGHIHMKAGIDDE